ncbi:MAG: type II secretion system protein [Xenococcus sp. MO_188.B8]|nr:type II secretion system protein [Xenococcus sp. MO_188.B8]
MNNLFAAKLLQNLRNKKSNKGFTLIELLVVVIIIGVLAAIALPNLLGQVAKGRQAEARNTLGTINRAQQAHRLEFGNFGEIGVYSQAALGDPVTLTTAPDPNNALPLALQLEYYQIQDNAGPDPTFMQVDATSIDTYENDILDYIAQVTQVGAGFASIICEEAGINGAAPVADGAVGNLVTECTGGKEVN